jgi:pyruvate,water dikinase
MPFDSLKEAPMSGHTTRFCRRFEEVGMVDVSLVGGKNASLGELTRTLKQGGIRVPEGFATIADAYWFFLEGAQLRAPIAEALAAMQDGEATLEQTGSKIRALLLAAPVPQEVAAALHGAYTALGELIGHKDPDVAVRSSATAEDLPTASFAGQQESFLHVSGLDALLDAWRRCVASLFTDRAIAYRDANGFGHLDVALSVGVQRMVRADLGASGVAFTLDTETGFPHVVVIDAAWGLGESVVGGTVDPDEYVLFKPALSDSSREPILSRTRGRKAIKVVYSPDAGGTTSVATSSDERRAWVLDNADALQLGRWAAEIERHYGTPMDVEWAKDGVSGELSSCRPDRKPSPPGVSRRCYAPLPSSPTGKSFSPESPSAKPSRRAPFVCCAARRRSTKSRTGQYWSPP